jgi:hypothetical protein
LIPACVFDASKEPRDRGGAFMKRRGLGRVKMELSFIFMCMNLKKLAKRLWKTTTLISFVLSFLK